jgi:hypothetical protein
MYLVGWRHAHHEILWLDVDKDNLATVQMTQNAQLHIGYIYITYDQRSRGMYAYRYIIDDVASHTRKA